MKAVMAKKLLNEAGYSCTWSGSVNPKSGHWKKKTPDLLIVVKGGKMVDALSVVRGAVDDDRVAEHSPSLSSIINPTN